MKNYYIGSRATFIENFKQFSIIVFILGSLICHPGITKADSSSSSPSGIQKTPISFGFFPIVSTVALYKRFHPLRDYLSEKLGHPVDLQTAKDFPTFKKRTDNREYDIIITAPHFAIRAYDSGLYKIRATLTSDVQQLVIVQKNSSISDLKELARKKVSTPPKGALMTKMGIEFFNQIGLSSNNAPEYIHYNSHNAANEALIGGEVDAAIASTNIVKKAIKQGAAIKIIKNGLSLPNMATLVATDRDSELGKKLVDILVNMKNTEQGKQVLKKISFPGYRSVNENDYEVVRPYL